MLHGLQVVFKLQKFQAQVKLICYGHREVEIEVVVVYLSIGFVFCFGYDSDKR